MFPPYRHKMILHVVALDNVITKSQFKEFKKLQKKSNRQTLGLILALSFIAFIIKRNVDVLEETEK